MTYYPPRFEDMYPYEHLNSFGIDQSGMNGLVVGIVAIVVIGIVLSAVSDLGSSSSSTSSEEKEGQDEDVQHSAAEVDVFVTHETDGPMHNVCVEMDFGFWNDTLREYTNKAGHAVFSIREDLKDRYAIISAENEKMDECRMKDGDRFTIYVPDNELLDFSVHVVDKRGRSVSGARVDVNWDAWDFHPYSHKYTDSDGLAKFTIAICRFGGKCTHISVGDEKHEPCYPKDGDCFTINLG